MSLPDPAAAMIVAALHEDVIAQLAERLRPHLDTDRRLLTAAQAAERLGLHAKTVVRMAREGRLAAVKIGNGWRFPADQLTVAPQPRARPVPAPAARPIRRRPNEEPASVRAIRGETPARRAA